MYTTPDLAALAERFLVRESVIENLFEEYEREVEAFDLDISFYHYLVEEFAQASFMITALNGGDAVDCLESYDHTFDLYDDD